MSDLESNIPQAIQLVLDWGLPDNAVAAAVQTQAGLLAHLSPDQLGAAESD